MISNIHLRTMARYNRWQNESLYAAAATLPDARRREACGAYWGSIHGTLTHLYWADCIWLSRFEVVERPDAPLKQSAAFVAEWDALAQKRQVLDATLVDWCDSFPSGPVTGTLKWYSGAMGREAEAPLALVLTHLFNHQTHHRGQAHALLTRAGAGTADTDLIMMPPEFYPPNS